MQIIGIPRRAAALLVALVAGGAGLAGLATASDHQDTAEVELNPTLDMTDVYAFPSPTAGRIVLVMMSRPFLTPAQSADASFDENLLYQFKVDNDGDALEDRVIQVTFDGAGSGQEIEVRGPVAPVVVGAAANRVADIDPAVSGRINTILGSASAMQVFAGPRDDPFFIDLEAAFCILPDRKPEMGELSEPCKLNGVPPFRSAAEARNYVSGFNGLALVIELPVSELTTGGNTRIGLWGTISR